MSSSTNKAINEAFQAAAGRGRFTTIPETSEANASMNRLLRGEPPPAAEPEPEAPPGWHSADAGEGLGQRLPRTPPTMSDLIRGHRRHAQSERAAEAEAARAEREHGSEHRSW